MGTRIMLHLSLDKYIKGSKTMKLSEITEQRNTPAHARADQQGWHDAYSGQAYNPALVRKVFPNPDEQAKYKQGYREGIAAKKQEVSDMAVAEDASGGGTSSGSVATAIPGNGGFGKSIFMSRTNRDATKTTKRK